MRSALNHSATPSAEEIRAAAATGLYDPRFEHDACGVGFVAHIKGAKSHDIVTQALNLGLVEGRVLYTDSTHLKANANKNKYDVAIVAKSRADYWGALDAAMPLCLKSLEASGL